MKFFIKKVVIFLINAIGLNRPFLPLMWISDQINRVVKVDDMRFDANSIPAYYRGTNAKYGEEKTLKWIREYVKKDEIFYDIGANAGTFTIFSAVNSGAKVIAFEPESQNYAILNHNIFLNRLDDRVKAYNVAINNENIFSELNLSQYRKGGSAHNFEVKKDPYHKDFIPAFKQGVFGISLDSFVYDFKQPFPNHIKIDVDGNEYRIIEGMRKCLNDRRLKSVAIEINPVLDTDKKIIDIILNYGFSQILHPENSTKMINYFFIRDLSDS